MRSHGMRRAKPVARKKNMYKNTITMLGGHCSGSSPLGIRARVKRTGGNKKKNKINTFWGSTFLEKNGFYL